MVTYQTYRQIGVYGSNNRNQFELQKILGDGPNRLTYQQATAQIPAHFTDPTTPSICLFSFTIVKNRVKSVVDPTSEEKLREWELRVGQEEAERIRTEAVAAGKLLHHRLECWMRGAPLGPCPLSKKFYCKALDEHILPHLRNEVPPLGITVDGHFYPLSELTIVDFDRGYFGRFDLIVKIVTSGFEGYILLELKASRKEKEIAHLRDPIIQVVAYFEIWEVLARRFPDQVLSLVGIAIACAYGNGSGDLLILSKEEDLQPYRKEWDYWLNTFFKLVGLNSAA